MIEISRKQFATVKFHFILIGWLIIFFSIDQHDDSKIEPRSDPEIYSFFPLTNDIFSSKHECDRPNLPDSLLSFNHHFMIHYTTNGTDAVSSQDSNLNFIPDRIEKIADAFEKSYHVAIEQLHYRLPPSFKDGGKPYDVYVVDLNNSYGITFREGVDSTALEAKNVASYISFDNDFVGPGYHIQGDDAIKVIAAHEFFHAIQLGYAYRKTDRFFYELTAVWMEDQVFDEIDNYLYYLDYFFSSPDIPLNAISHTMPNIVNHTYGGCLFAFYIVENFGRDAIRAIWELMPEKSALEAMHEMFRRYQSSFEAEFVRFSMWNFFTGDRARPDFSYRNSSAFPEIVIKKDTLIDYYSGQSGVGYFLTSAYYIFHPRSNGNYQVRLTSKQKEHWMVGAVAFDDKTIRTCLAESDESAELEDIHTGQNILIVPCNVDRFFNPTLIYFKEEPEAYQFSIQREVKHASMPVKSFHIENVYPNPFVAEVTFSVRKLADTSLSIRIFNVQGQLVEQLLIPELPQELNPITWRAITNRTQRPSGIYVCRFEADGFSETVKVVLCK